MKNLKIAFYAHAGMLCMLDNGELSHKIVEELENEIKLIHGENILNQFVRWAEKLNHLGL